MEADVAEPVQHFVEHPYDDSKQLWNTFSRDATGDDPAVPADSRGHRLGLGFSAAAPLGTASSYEQPAFPVIM